MTEELLREDAYLKTCEATVTAVGEQGIVLDRTIFYATGGGQPGDTGTLTMADGRVLRITDTIKDRDSGAHLHIAAEGSPMPGVGDMITCSIDCDRRYRLMRMHSALHLLCAVVAAPVTGGNLTTDKGRLDFDLPELAEGELILDLGSVNETCRVKVNGRSLGSSFFPPHRFDVSGRVKPGKNRLEVEVSNLAANRIADLDRRGVEWKRFHEINFVNVDYKPFDASGWKLQPSGLLGPVCLVPVK